MNQISPRVFEAIVMRTALVLYEGEYSGIVEPGRHYFALKKDYSNFDDAVRFVRDPASVHAMTDRAFADIVASGRYGHETLAATFDRGLDALGYSSGRQSTAGHWSLAPVYVDGSLQFMLLNSDVGDRRRAIARRGRCLPTSYCMRTRVSSHCGGGIRGCAPCDCAKALPKTNT